MMLITLALLSTLLNVLVITHLLGLTTPLLNNLAKVLVLNCGSNMSNHCILEFKASLSQLDNVHVPIKFAVPCIILL